MWSIIWGSMNNVLGHFKNRRVVGSLLVGFGLVAGSLVVSNLRTPNPEVSVAPLPSANKAPERQFIAVKDSDNDGIEDWRAEFVSRTPILVAQATTTETPYVAPSTITDAMGIRFFENILQAKAGLGMSEEEVVQKTAEQVVGVVKDALYTTRDITTVPTTEESIRLYGNTMGAIILNNNVPGYDSEVAILDRALKMESEEEVQKLLPLENVYRTMRDEALKTPVPNEFAKEHTDVINTYNALYASIRDMRLVFDDPVISLMRIKRYEDDATGLGNALRNLYLALEPHASLFTPDDPAVVLVAFAPNFQ